MQALRFLRDTFFACCVLSCAGCSSLGLSCFPTGHGLQPGDLLQIEPDEIDPEHRYYVLGEVNSPGSYPLEGHETVLDAILAAGGLSTAAAPCKILLARPPSPSSCRITLPVCYREITQPGDTATNYQMQPGDRVFVAPRTWCEEMMIWQATKSCTRCCDCQTACADPNMVGYPNPVTQVSGEVFSSGLGIGNAVDSESSEMPDPPSGCEAIIGEASRFTTGIRTDQASPARLPSPVDGELEFGPGESSDRFEPLWITPASDRAARSESRRTNAS